MGENGQGESPPFRHHLLPPGRSAATWLLERQESHQTTAVIGLRDSLGHEGNALLACLLLWGLMGTVLVWAGLGCLFGSGGHVGAERLGYVLLLVGMALAGEGLLRGYQMAREHNRLRQRG